MRTTLLIILFCIIGYSKAVKQESFKVSPYEREDMANDLFLLPIYMCQGYNHFQDKKDGKNYVPTDMSQNDLCQQFNQFDDRFKTIVKDLPEVSYKNELQYFTLSYVQQLLNKYFIEKDLAHTQNLPNYANLISDTCEDYLTNIPSCDGWFLSPECNVKQSLHIKYINSICNKINYRINSTSLVHQITGLTTEELDKGSRWMVVNDILRLKQEQKQNNFSSLQTKLQGFNIFGGLLVDYCTVMEDQCSYWSFTKQVTEKCRAAAIGCKRQDYQYYRGWMNKNEQQSALRIVGRIEKAISDYGGWGADVFNECYTLRDLCIRQIKTDQCTVWGCHFPQWQTCYFRCSDWLNQFVDSCNTYIFNNRPDSSICEKYVTDDFLSFKDITDENQDKKDWLFEQAYASFMH